MKTLFSLLLIVLPFTVIAQSNWISIGKGTNDEEMLMQDRYATKNNTTIEVWTKIKKRKIEILDKTYKNAELKTLYSLNCGERKLLVKRTILYSEKGDVIVESRQRPTDNYDDVVPDTLGEILLDKACELFK